MNKILKNSIIFLAIIAFPAICKAENPVSQTDTSATAVQCKKNCAADANYNCYTPCGKLEPISDLSSSDTILTKTESAVDSTKINLNFKFKDNKTTFTKAVDILLIGFAVVFVVMIIFMFVSKGIDKIFPYKKDDGE